MLRQIILRGGPVFQNVRAQPTVLRRSYALGSPAALGVHNPDETQLKAKLPIWRRNDPEQEHVTMGKLREDLHSVAKVTLEFIRLDSVVSMSPEELENIVVVPKEAKLNIHQRVEKLEQELSDAKRTIEELKKKK